MFIGNITRLITVAMLVVGIMVLGMPIDTSAITEATGSAASLDDFASDANTETSMTSQKPREIAIVSASGLLGDHSINQASWRALLRVAREKNVGMAHYAAEEQDNVGGISAIMRAIEGGAKIIVAPGILFETPVWLIQNRYPNVKFVLVDAAPHNSSYMDESIAKNTAVIKFAQDEAGFLAGYAAVKSGRRALGFLGAMPEPEIADAGIGFIKGADYAAREDELPAGSVTVDHVYAGTFFADETVCSFINDWLFQEPNNINTDITVSDSASEESIGVGNTEPEFVFAVGGDLEAAVADTCRRLGKSSVLFGGVDSLSSGSTSAEYASAVILRHYEDAVYSVVMGYYNRKFQGGGTTVFGTKDGGIDLQFNSLVKPLLSESDYVRILEILASEGAGMSRSIRRSYVQPNPIDASTSHVLVSVRRIW